MSENEKDKENKKMSETESFEGYEEDAMENAEESSAMEKDSSSERSLPIDICSPPRSPPVIEGTEIRDEESLTNSYEDRKKRILEEKWYNVTGKKPKSIPVVRKYFDENMEKFIFFGDRRPAEVEQQRREHLLKAAQKVPHFGYNQGKILLEEFNQSQFSGLLCIKFEPGGENMATGDRKGQVQLRKTSDGSVTMCIKTMDSDYRLPVKGLNYHPIYTNKLYISGDLGKVQVYDVYTKERLAVSESLTPINVMDISSDGSFLAVGGREGRVVVVDPTTFQVISSRQWPQLEEAAPPRLNDHFHRLRIYGLKFHPTQTNLFVTGGWDGTVKVWDVRVQGAIKNVNGPKIYGSGVDINEKEIITAAWQAEDSLNLWTFPEIRFIKNIQIKNKSTEFEGEFLYTTRFFSDNPNFPMVSSRLIAFGGSGFFNLLVLNIDTEQIIASFPAFKSIVGLDICGNVLAYGGKESLFRVGKIEQPPRMKRK